MYKWPLELLVDSHPTDDRTFFVRHADMSDVIIPTLNAIPIYNTGDTRFGEDTTPGPHAQSNEMTNPLQKVMMVSFFWYSSCTGSHY